jgi:predicted nucleic acid-binding protein
MAILTIDASVFINSVNRREDGYAESNRFMRRIHNKGHPVIVPTLLLVELAATIARGQGKPTRADRFVRTIYEMSHFTFVPLDESVMWNSIEIAAQYQLRGSDAVYVAVARRYGATLVTLDREQRERVTGVVTVQSPAEAFATLVPPPDEDG